MHKNAIIYNELKELNSSLSAIEVTNVFSVPAGYFETLSDSILKGIHDQSPLNELKAGLQNMQVPKDYFEGLADSIMNRIRQESLEEVEEDLAFVSKTNVFSVPTGYFEGLANEIMSKIENQEDESALLVSIGKENVYTIPMGYFDGVSDTIISKIPRESAKLIQMKPRYSVFKYAAAAAITGIIGLSLFSIFDNKNIIQTGTGGVAVVNTVEVEPANSSILLAAATEILKNNSFDKEMADLNEEDIVDYLQKGGNDLNAALVASVTDEKNLPGEQDYFIDEKTLDNFLNEQHLVQNSTN